MKKLIVLLPLCFILMTGNALAMPANDLLQEVFDDITFDGDSAVNAFTDMLSDDLDSYWSITDPQGIVVTLIIRLAGFGPKNNFGVYDATDPSKYVQMFDGSAMLGNQKILSIKSGGSVWLNNEDTGVKFAGNLFGFYLDATHEYPDAGFWYSDTSLNSDGFDHLLAYQGKNDLIQLPAHEPKFWTSKQYILAFEDLIEGGDKDFTDFVFLLESAVPMASPEPPTPKSIVPSTLLLLDE